MNQYETVFILTPVLSDVQMKEAVEKFKAILTQEGAEIINEENWGLKKLAYPIQKKSTGFYQLIEFKAEPSVIEKLEVNYRRDERVIRFLTFKMDKYAAEYAAKRRNVKSTKKELEEMARFIANKTLKEALHGLTLEELRVSQEVLRKIFTNTKD
jgi:small subunit ribosomal protein S6